MKKTLLLLACVLFGFIIAEKASAQNTVTNIRERYADIKKRIELMSEEGGWPPEYYQVNVFQNLPATGPHKEDVRMYYDEVKTEEDEIYPPHRLSFATCRYNFAPRIFYEEYLYDEDGKPAFIYARNPDIEFGIDYDFRFYFNKEKLIKVVIKCRPGEDSDPRLLQKNWDASAPTDGEGWREVYSGTRLPKEYESLKDAYLNSAKKILKLFDAVDSSTHL